MRNWRRATHPFRRLSRPLLYASALLSVYYSGRQSAPDACSSAGTTVKRYHVSSDGVRPPVSSDYTSVIVMGRLANETDKVQWVEKLWDIDSEIYVVDDTSQSPHLEVNHGREAAVYLRYIIDNYDSLPDIVFFWHHDEEVWHNNMLLNWSSVVTINRMDRNNIIRQGYVPSRCDHWPGCPTWIRFNPSRAEHTMDPHKLEDMFTPELFERLFPSEEIFPPYFAGTCCSQFAVSREAIRSRPRRTYQTIFDWVAEYEWDDRSGMVLEYTWPYIFTKRGTLCPSMQECYCKTYNLCIELDEDVAALEDWNNLRTRREEMRWQLKFMEEAWAAQERKNLDTHIGKSTAVEAGYQAEIEHLSKELETLTTNTWLSREALVKHWDLSVPPTGW